MTETHNSTTHTLTTTIERDLCLCGMWYDAFKKINKNELSINSSTRPLKLFPTEKTDISFNDEIKKTIELNLHTMLRAVYLRTVYFPCGCSCLSHICNTCVVYAVIQAGSGHATGSRS